MKRIRLFFRRIFCHHRNLVFERNIYGDEIIYSGWKRSLWRCSTCGVLKAKEKLGEYIDYKCECGASEFNVPYPDQSGIPMMAERSAWDFAVEHHRASSPCRLVNYAAGGFIATERVEAGRRVVRISSGTQPTPKPEPA